MKPDYKESPYYIEDEIQEFKDKQGPEYIFIEAEIVP
jgi:hypothetical protein